MRLKISQQDQFKREINQFNATNLQTQTILQNIYKKKPRISFKFLNHVLNTYPSSENLYKIIMKISQQNQFQRETN